MTAVPSAAGAARTPPKGTALQAVLDNRDALVRELDALGGTNIAVFGSVARGEERQDSDIDLLVDLAPETGLFAILRMQRAAEGILGRTVDIVPRKGLKPEVAASVQHDAIEL